MNQRPKRPAHIYSRLCDAPGGSYSPEDEELPAWGPRPRGRDRQVRPRPGVGRVPEVANQPGEARRNRFIYNGAV